MARRSRPSREPAHEHRATRCRPGAREALARGPWISAAGAFRPAAGDARSLAAAYALSWAVVVLLVVSSVGGLVWGTRGLYQADPFLLPQFLGQDAVTLVAALPLLLWSMRAGRRGSVRGVLLWAAMLFYVSYWYYFYVVGVQFGPLFLVHLALVSASTFGLLVLLAGMDGWGVRARFDPGYRTGLAGAFLVAMGALFLAMWTARVATGSPLPDVSRHVYVVDLVVMLPLAVAGGIGLWRRTAWGYALGGVLLVKSAATMVMLLTNTAFLHLRGEPTDVGQTVAYAATLVVAAAFTIRYFRAAGAAARVPLSSREAGSEATAARG